MCFTLVKTFNYWSVAMAYAQRFAAWRRAGFLALMYIGSTNVEPCTNVSTKHETPPFAKPLLN